MRDRKWNVAAFLLLLMRWVLNIWTREYGWLFEGYSGLRRGEEGIITIAVRLGNVTWNWFVCGVDCIMIGSPFWRRRPKR